MQKINTSQEIMGADMLEHLGLVMATIDKLGIIEQIDKILPLGKTAKTSMGQRAAAMIMNGLGFVDDRLYLFPKFLENKPLSRLFGSEVLASDFNDDALGRFLDAVHEYGETKLYSEIALPIGLKHNLLRKSAHFDTTSISVYGEYDNDGELLSGQFKLESRDRLELSKKVKPEYGYAKNKRVDLKQMTLLMATTGASGFPIWMESHSGNASDKKTLEEASQRMQKFCKELESSPKFLYVGDSAMYASCVKQGKDLLWLSRVPENMNLSKELLSKTDVEWVNLDNGYKIYILKKEYGEVEQRWAMVYSEQAYNREIITLEKNIDKENKEVTKLLWHISNDEYGCEKDVELQIKKISKKLKYHEISYTIQDVMKHENKGRPKKGEEGKKCGVSVETALVRNEVIIEEIRLTKGRFILATNQLDSEALADKEILSTYKEQSGTESGFKFIKDDTFELDSIFLKKPGRISALMMVMTLCLMVYSYAQYFLREELLKQNETIKSQSNRDTNKPTMKWVYRLFQGVCVLNLKIGEEKQEVVLNLNEELKRIVTYFGECACGIYGING